MRKWMCAALAPVLLNGCTAVALAIGVEATVYGSAMILGTAVVSEVAENESKKSAPSKLKVYGNYKDETGSIFNPTVFWVEVTSDKKEESLNHARDIAQEACRQKKGGLKVLQENYSQPGLFFKDQEKHTYSIRFEC
jgi:hypothetical protein